MNNYLNCKNNFPWKYTYKQKIINKISFHKSIKTIEEYRRKKI